MKELLTEVAKKAGDKLLEHFNKDAALIKMRGSSKGVVTKYDEVVDEFIAETIWGEYPNHSMLTEEKGFVEKGSEYVWIVDSIDGTANFAAGNPLFSLCVALMKDDELIFGAINAPAINEFYFAEKGKGAFLNGEKIQVSTSSKLDESYVFMCEGGEKNRKRTLGLVNAVYPNTTDLRKIGSGGIEAAWVALGRGDAHVTTSIEPWDVAAGVLLVKEAGGKVTDFKGGEWKREKSDLVFSNGRIHEQILEIVKGY